jgi:hypothetical protein
MNMRNITCGKHEVEGRKVGETLTVTNYVTARFGSGMDRVGTVTGRLVSVDNPTVRRGGCSFVWSEVTLDVADGVCP